MDRDQPQDAGETRRTGGAAPLTWGICTATLDRTDVLERSLRCSLAQTRPPSEVVIVDAGERWECNRDRIALLFADRPEIRYAYLPSPVRSLTARRNAGIAAASADVLFMIDDDSLMFPDCAEAVMRVYEQANGKRIAAVSIPNVPDAPDADGPAVAARRSGVQSNAAAIGRLYGNPLFRWFWTEVALMSLERQIRPYDPPGTHPTRDEFDALGLAGADFAALMSGFGMTVRRSVALREGFEPHFLSYSPAEDVDASYRFSRHGFIAAALDARLHHAEAAAGRIRRHQSTQLRLMNFAYLARKHGDPAAGRGGFYRFLACHVFAEFVKDTLSRRLDYPQFRGALKAARRVPRILGKDRGELGPWYLECQKEVLGWK